MNLLTENYKIQNLCFKLISYLCSHSVALQMLQRSRELTKQGCILEASIEAGAKEIIRIKDSLNEWDSKVGDGDCGTTVSQKARTTLCYFLVIIP